MRECQYDINQIMIYSTYVKSICVPVTREVKIKAWQSQKGVKYKGTVAVDVRGIPIKILIADKRYDAKSVVAFAMKSRMNAVIPSRSNTKKHTTSRHQYAHL